MAGNRTRGGGTVTRAVAPGMAAVDMPVVMATVVPAVLVAVMPDQVAGMVTPAQVAVPGMVPRGRPKATDSATASGTRTEGSKTRARTRPWTPADEPVMRPPADWDGPTTELRRGDELYPGARTPFATTTGLDPDTCYRVEGRGNFFTDDSGTIVRAEMSYGGKGNLNWDLNRPQPNMTYVVTPDVNNPVDGFDYRHEFTTDDQGRVVGAQTDNLAFGEATRSGSIQGRIGKVGGEGFEGGHLFAKWFGGGPESLNLVPMHWELNRGTGPSYKALEGRWATLMQEDPPVVIGNVRILPEYDGSDAKPRSITVAWEENGRNRMREFETNG